MSTYTIEHWTVPPNYMIALGAKVAKRTFTVEAPTYEAAEKAVQNLIYKEERAALKGKK